MARFFFHIIHSDHRVEDPEGAEFKNLRAAQDEAAATLRDLIADAQVRHALDAWIHRCPRVQLVSPVGI
jgi:hypothetical protein